jgi:hypothetical protein
MILNNDDAGTIEQKSGDKLLGPLTYHRVNINSITSFSHLCYYFLPQL